MAWIESHQKLSEDPKLYDLIDSLSIDKNCAIGILHRFWWWCVDHAETGDLRPFNDNQLARTVEWNGQNGKNFVEGMVLAKFIEREPYFRVSNWWKFTGKYLQSKYKSTPEHWRKILLLYTEVRQKKRRSNTGTHTGHTGHTGHTKNIRDKNTLSLELDRNRFEEFWNLYPKKHGKRIGKKECVEVFRKLKPDDLPRLLLATKNYADSERAKDGFAKDPIRFLRSVKGGYVWEDWLEPESAESKESESDRFLRLSAEGKL